MSALIGICFIIIAFVPRSDGHYDAGDVFMGVIGAMMVFSK